MGVGVGVGVGVWGLGVGYLGRCRLLLRRPRLIHHAPLLAVTGQVTSPQRQRGRLSLPVGCWFWHGRRLARALGACRHHLRGAKPLVTVRQPTVGRSTHAFGRPLQRHRPLLHLCRSFLDCLSRPVCSIRAPDGGRKDMHLADGRLPLSSRIRIGCKQRVAKICVARPPRETDHTSLWLLEVEHHRSTAKGAAHCPDAHAAKCLVEPDWLVFCQAYPAAQRTRSLWRHALR